MSALLTSIMIGYFFLFNQGIAATQEEQTDPVVELEKEFNIIKMKRTRSDISSIAIAVESYAVDHTKYPWVDEIEELMTYLQPIYIRAIPQNDAWGTKFKFVAQESTMTYQIISAGADRRFDPSNWSSKDPYTDLNDDVVYENGSFLRDWKPPEKQVLPGASAALRARIEEYVQGQPLADINLEKRELGWIVVELNKLIAPGEMNEWLQHVDSIEKKFPQSARASLAHALFSLMARDLKEASAALKRAETLFPAYAQLRLEEEIRLAKRNYTLADMRAIATAVEAFNIDYNTYPVEKEGTIENIRGKLESTYISKLPLMDAWENPLVYRCMEAKGPYWIISHGADGKPDAGIYSDHGVPVPSAAGQGSDDNADVIFSDGTFFRYPEDR